MRIKLIVFLLCLCAAAGVVSCDDTDNPILPGEGALVVGLKELPATPPDSLTLYFFSADGGMAARKSYAGLRAFQADYTPLQPGSYTVVLVAGVPLSVQPARPTLQELAEWLKSAASACPGMMTAMAAATVTENEVGRLLLTVPGLDLAAYDGTRSGGKPLRCVVEVDKAGGGGLALRRELSCLQQADGTYLAELSLMPGDYDLRLWADWDGGYYNADDLGKVIVLTDNYVANGETDKKDAYYGSLSLTLPTGEGTQTGQSLPTGEVGGAQSSPLGEFEGAVVEGALVRPFAKYRLIATDVEAYYNLIEKGEALPPIEDLQVCVTYEGFFPTGFNVATGKPNDALNTGIHYTSVPTVAEGYDAKVNRQVGADFVLTNGEESFVNVTIEMIDTNTGEAVATVQHVKIPYKRGHLTTVTGHFLTAGKTPGGVQIDTEWGEDITIEF
ncbi:MAG TPA: hypothetical protein H9986_02060 [Candidatus Prevotella stercoripullorum]|nr:hypothetical protein [Candidatus Prevotella stercoripullorum]